jgi:hypothetical protein
MRIRYEVLRNFIRYQVLLVFEGKVKVSPVPKHHAIKVFRGHGGKSPRIIRVRH